VSRLTTTATALRVVPGMTYAVLVKIDAAGRRAVIAGPDTFLNGGEGARWQYVAQTNDLSEAERIHEVLRAKLEREAQCE
jgi:hypothetical protein